MYHAYYMLHVTTVNVAWMTQTPHMSQHGASSALGSQAKVTAPNGAS